MAKRATGKAGVKARFFLRVVYDRAELDAHNEAMREMILRDAWCEFISTGPAAGGKTHLCFAIAEDEADAYLRRLRAARRSSRLQTTLKAG